MVNALPFGLTMMVFAGGTSHPDAMASAWFSMLYPGLDIGKLYALDLTYLVDSDWDSAFSSGQVYVEGVPILEVDPNKRFQHHVVRVRTGPFLGAAGGAVTPPVHFGAEISPLLPIGGRITATFTLKSLDLLTVPEPGSGIVCGGGMLFLAILRLLKLRQSERQQTN
ncbi:hypothetical protein [Paludibaculum fermentans]|uniref:hypothetical protein n=1 Tax=Paludibaculum fermentans TaxID=1473598 RepID=UPI003EB9FD02